MLIPEGSPLEAEPTLARARDAVCAGTQIVIRAIERSAESVGESASGRALALIEAARHGEREGFGAIGICDCSDLGLTDCRAAVAVPVSAPFEAISKLLPALGPAAVLYTSAELAGASPDADAGDWVNHLIARNGCADHVTSVRALPTDAGLETITESVLIGAGQGSRVVVLASFAWTELLPALGAPAGVAVLDPLTELARHLELLAAARAAGLPKGLAQFAHEVPLVPLTDGTSTRFVNFDYAASAPPLQSVEREVAAAMANYASIHRGPSHLSRASTEAYEQARDRVSQATRARSDDAVIFTRNTTDALTLLSACVIGRVVHFDFEHHANLLPWRRGQVTAVPARDTVAASLQAIECELARAPAALLTVTGASNVTGECPPLAQLAEMAHRMGTRLAVDGAQLAPHRAVNISAAEIDYLVCSGHKLYAPYGSGALIGRPDWLDAAPPHQPGGGAVVAVTLDSVQWKSGAARHEGGTPNLAGAVAMGAALKTLHEIGFDTIAAHEMELYDELVEGLRRLEIEPLRFWPEHDELVGVVSFNVPGYNAGAVAAYLSAEHGVGVRSGKFCAHPLLSRFGLGDGGALRASIGLGTTPADVGTLLGALAQLLSSGPKSTYRRVDGYLVPASRDHSEPASAISATA